MSRRARTFRRIIISSNRRRSGVSAPVAPEYSSGTIGVVDSKTIEITFTENVSADSDNFMAGVTVMVGSVEYDLASGTLQSDNTKVRYVLDIGVDGTESVTWAYAKSGGTINSGGEDLENVSAQAVTNSVIKPADLSGDVHWWHVRPSGSGDTLVIGSDGATATWTSDSTCEAATFIQATHSNKPALIAAGAAGSFNDLAVADFDGSSDTMTSSVDQDTLFGAGAKLMYFVIKVDAVTGDTWWGGYDGLMNDTSGCWGVNIDNSSPPQILQGNYHGVVPSPSVGVNLDLTNIKIVQLRHDGTNIYASVNGGTEASVTSGNTACGGSSIMDLASNYNQSNYFEGKIAEILLSNNVESSGDRAAIQTMLENIYTTGTPVS